MADCWWLHKPTIVEFPRERLHPPDLTNHSLFSSGRKWGCFFLLFLSFIWYLLPHWLTSSIFFFKLHFSNLVLSFAQKWKKGLYPFHEQQNCPLAYPSPSTNNKRLKEMYTISACRTHPPMKKYCNWLPVCISTQKTISWKNNLQAKKHWKRNEDKAENLKCNSCRFSTEIDWQLLTSFLKIWSDM